MNAVFKVRKYAPDYAGLVGRDLTPQGLIEQYAFAVVNGAGMTAGSVASGAIMSAFGSSLAADAGVRITDNAGVTQSCPLFYASPTQINLLVPDGCAPGPATLTIGSASANVVVESVAPGLFSANASGKGVGAIIGLRVDGNGQRSDVPIFTYDAAAKQYVAVPIDLGASTDLV
jgi:uncharacterized protein (TIGR03437 family)